MKKDEKIFDVLIADASVSGHHIYYNTILLCGLNSRINISILSSQKSQYSGYHSFGFHFFETNRLIKNINYLFFVVSSFYLAKRKKIDIIHFISGDDFIFPLSIVITISKIFFKRIKIYITFHWFYNSNKRNYIIKQLSNKKNIEFVFHSDLIQQKYIDYGISKLKSHVINYPIKKPVLVEKYECRKVLGIGETEKVLLLYGSLRYDKGIDLALNSLSLTNSKPLLLIVGQEKYFTDKIINKIAGQYNVTSRIRFDKGFIPEEKVPYYFGACDAVLIPYRNYFGGQSGILFDAVTYNKPVIAAAIEHIKIEVINYNLGLLFTPESTDEMAKRIDDFFSGEPNEYINVNSRGRFLDEHNSEQFIDKHYYLYTG